MLLADLVDVLDHTATAQRRADKVAGLSALLRRTPIEEVDSVVALAVGTHRPAHDIGGWTATLRDEYPAAAASSLTVDDVRRVIEEMSIASGPQAVEAAAHSIVVLLGRASEPEQDAIKAMLDPGGESPVTVSVVSTAVANAARVRVGDVRRAASVTGSLPVTATLAFLEGTTALESVEPRAGRPIQPMQAAPVEDLDEVMFDRACVEWAPVGVRLQAHRAGRAVSLFAHDGVTSVEVTDRLPAIADIVRGLPGDDLVLDGELAGADIPDPGTVDSARRVWFFDLLFDGTALLQRPLGHRRRALAVLVPDELRLPSIEASEPAEVERFLADARSRGRTGVVLKDLGSAYEPGQRGRSWRRFAPVHTLDLVVVAAEWGSGRRSDKLSRLHLAARTVAGDFITVGRTAVGVTDEMLTWQTERLLQLAIDEDHSVDVVTVRPEQVVEVAFDSVYEARRGGHSLSLRAARVRRYRDDLRVADCDTIETVRSHVQGDQRSAAPSDQIVTGPRRRADDEQAELTDSAPRLPPARPPGLDAAQAEAAKRIREVLADQEAEPPEEEEEPPPPIPPPAGLPVSGYLRGHISKLDLDFEPYEEPVLESGRATHKLVMLARFLTLGWAVALTTGALITRSEPGPIDPSLVRSLGWIGIPIVIALAVTGWAWSDQLTRNLKRLDGRLPSRLRCVSAWLTPLALVGLLAITIVRLEPTDVVDVRPSILVVVYAAAMWRPYSLIRRIFATLIRIRFDSLLAAGYVLDLVGFGLLWWRLTTWSNDSVPKTQGDVEILIGIGAAVAVAFAANVIVWRGIIRSGDRAEAHRAASQRTRYEHRMLRLRGVDPTDPEVWWALVQRRADEQRAADERRAAEEAAAAAAATGVDEDVPVEADMTPPVVPTVDELVEDVKQRHSVAFRRLGEEESEQLEDRLREQFSTVVGDLAGMPLDAAPTTDPAAEAETVADEAPELSDADVETADAAETPDSDVETPDSDVETPDADVETPDADVETPDSDVETPDADDVDADVSPAEGEGSTQSEPAPAGAPASLLESLRDIATPASEEEVSEEPLTILRSVVKRAGDLRVVRPVDDETSPGPGEAPAAEPAAREAPGEDVDEVPDDADGTPASGRPGSPLDQLASRMGTTSGPPAGDAPGIAGSRPEPASSGNPLDRLSARTGGGEPDSVDGGQGPLEGAAAESGDDGVDDRPDGAEPGREPASSGSPLDRLSARTGGGVPASGEAVEAQETRAESDDGTVEEGADGAEPRREPAASGSPLDRLSARTGGAEPAATGAPGPPPRLGRVAAPGGDADPVSALKRRLGLDETVVDVKSPLEQLLDQAGTVQVEAALAEHRQQEIEERPSERLVPPKLYALEWTRLLLVTSFAVVTACGGWLVTESLGASGASSDGSLGDAALDVDLARRAFVGAYSVAIALIPLWTFTVLTYARRCGMDQAQPRRHLALFALSSSTCVLAFVLDGGVRGDTSALLLIPGALIAGAAGYLVEPARFWFDLPSVTLTVWTIAVPAVLGIAWVGGLLRPVDSTASLELLAFFTVTVSLMSALITVLIALSASDIEDEIRLSPELAVPVSESGRGRS